MVYSNQKGAENGFIHVQTAGRHSAHAFIQEGLMSGLMSVTEIEGCGLCSHQINAAEQTRQIFQSWQTVLSEADQATRGVGLSLHLLAIKQANIYKVLLTNNYLSGFKLQPKLKDTHA